MEVCNACGDGPCFKDVFGEEFEVSVRCGKPSSPMWRDIVRDSEYYFDLLHIFMAEEENIAREIDYTLDAMCGDDAGEETTCKDGLDPL